MKTVDTLPIAHRDFVSLLDTDELAWYALMCWLGEQVDLTTAQVYWLNHTFHDRPSDQFTFREWILQLTEATYGLEDLFNRELTNTMLHIQNHPLDIHQREQILEELNAVGYLIEENASLLARLFGLQPIGYRKTFHSDEDGAEVFFKLRDATLLSLAEGGFMQPITAAQWLLITRPCEHVMLTPVMLDWANRVPAVRGTPKFRAKGWALDLPRHTPKDAREYSKHEYHVRRLQRTYFPGRTALEAHVIIHESEHAYEKKYLAYEECRARRRELHFNHGAGI